MIQIRLPCIFLIALLLICRASIAEDYTSPENIAGSTKINAESLIQMARENEDLIIIDSRIHSDRRQGYITGSISLPDTDTNCDSLSSVIPHNDSTVVFYCNGPKCRRSDLAVSIARQCGYTNIYWFRGGFEEWNQKQYLINK